MVDIPIRQARPSPTDSIGRIKRFRAELLMNGSLFAIRPRSARSRVTKYSFLRCEPMKKSWSIAASIFQPLLKKPKNGVIPAKRNSYSGMNRGVSRVGKRWQLTWQIFFPKARLVMILEPARAILIAVLRSVVLIATMPLQSSQYPRYSSDYYDNAVKNRCRRSLQRTSWFLCRCLVLSRNGMDCSSFRWLIIFLFQ